MFVKHTNQSKIEVQGLNILSEYVRTPFIYDFNDTSITMEKIESGASSLESDIILANDLYNLHKVTSKNNKFGWDNDNYIGLSIQKNDWKDNWNEFFIDVRLEYQINLPNCNSLLLLWNETKDTINDILSNVNEPPSLTHGDLWAGNILIDKKTNTPVFIDPAVSYSHRETDLAMMKLFGGFSQKVFSQYNELWPLQSGYKERNYIYQLYHILNHVNIFGGCYKSQAQNLFSKFQ